MTGINSLEEEFHAKSYHEKQTEIIAGLQSKGRRVDVDDRCRCKRREENEHVKQYADRGHHG
jgi:hypothetical protein